jgi:hypothetical protein
MITTGTYFVSPSETFLDINSADGIVNIVLPTSEAISSYLSGTGGLLSEQISYSISGTSSYPVRFYRGGDKFWNNGLQFIEITQDGEGNISTQGGIQAIAESGTPNSGTIQLIGKKIGLSLNPNTINTIMVIVNKCDEKIEIGQTVTDAKNGTTADIVGVVYSEDKKQISLNLSNIVGGGFVIGNRIIISTRLSCESQVLDYTSTQQSQLISLVGGNKFVVTSLLITNPSTIIDTANGGFLYSGDNMSSGVQVANINFVNDLVKPPYVPLIQADSFMNDDGNITLYPISEKSPNNLLIGNDLYFNIETVQDATCDMYVYGVVIN